MIRLVITPAAFEAIAETLLLGSVGYEPEPNEKGERLIGVEAAVVDRLTALRRAGESQSDVILRLIKLEVRRRSKRICGTIHQTSLDPPDDPHRHHSRSLRRGRRHAFVLGTVGYEPQSNVKASW